MPKQVLVTRSSMPPLKEYLSEINSLWESHWLTNSGIKHQQLETQLKEYLNCDNLALFCNGHSALECIIEAMDLKGEVITTPFTFASTTHAIVRKGLTPVFADIKKDNYTIDPDSIEKLISPSTCAILAVHVYGNLCDVDRIQKIANKYNLKVIYDGAHAFGVKHHGTSVANFGDATMFSFHATKVFNTIEGGAACFRDSRLCKKANQLKNFGITENQDVKYVGGNFKMNEFCAAMGICNLRHIDEEIQKRKEITKEYYKRLYNYPGIKLIEPIPETVHNYAYMPVLFEDSFSISRDEAYTRLIENNIFTRKYFYPLISDFECYSDLFASDDTPVAKYVADRVLTLPLYADLSIKEVERICNLILA